eukprot:TRINITY_DN2314_c0_g1_i2.p1 TRINITY_DN2314_c0_g1~~TRINITY_DN2314_c0_g1_i2.p1  ORF type:complete len:699 (-),score=213.39 TRINITY_DN2314_c0_g1_i2:40-2040(-)
MTKSNPSFLTRWFRIGGGRQREEVINAEILNEFRSYLVDHTVPEWQFQYLDFDSIVSVLHNEIERKEATRAMSGIYERNINNSEDETRAFMEDYIQIDEPNLWAMLDDEYNKINNFFSKMHSQVKDRLEELEREVQDFNEQTETVKVGRTKGLITEAFVETYKGISMLQSYCTVNHGAALELINIYEKIEDVEESDVEYANEKKREIASNTAKLNQQPFWIEMPQISEMIIKTEKLYSKTFGLRGDKVKGLLSRPAKKLSRVSIFNLGLWCGVNVALLGVLILLFVWNSEQFNSQAFFSGFPVFRGVGMLLLQIWCWGGMTWIYNRWRINYVFILQLDPPSALGPYQIFKMASFVTSIWLTCFIFFTIHTKTGFSLLAIEHEMYPVILIGILLVLAFNPFHFFYRSTRLWLGKALWTCLCSPLSNTVFVHFFLSDILTSMPKFFGEVEYIACYFSTGDWRRNEAGRCESIVSLLLPYTIMFPLWIRFWQCIRRFILTKDKEHLANAGKYFSSMSCQVFGAINRFQSYSEIWEVTRIFWAASFCVATIYVYVWDIVMDWGLGLPRNRTRFLFLRNNLVFRPFVYYLIIFLDGIGRFSWTWALTATPIPGLNKVYYPLVFAGIEIFRRSMWGIIRVENEHLKNCVKYRALREVVLPKFKKQPSDGKLQ